MKEPNDPRRRLLSLSERIVRATLWTILIAVVMVAWSFAASCDMPGSCT